MINLYLDSSIFACPSPNAGHDALENFIEKLLAWRGWYERSWIRMLQLSSGIDVLSREDYFPSSPRISALIKSMNRVDLQAGDIVRLINSLMERACFVEEYVESYQCLVDKVDSFEITPSTYSRGRGAAFEKLFQDLLIYSAMIQYLSRVLPDHPVAHVVNDSLSDPHFSVARVQACVSNVSEATPPHPNPLEFDEELLVCNQPQQLLTMLDPVSVWMNGAANNDLIVQGLALTIKVVQVIGLVDETPPWGFGRDFIVSAKNLGFGHEPDKIRRLQRACVETILDRNTDDTHHLRTGQGANDPQRIRNVDGAGAWRRDIDRHFHLHYWKIGTRVEFANVVPHNEFGITD